MRLPFLMEPIERLRDVLTKGTLFVGDGDRVPATLAPGAEGTVLTRRGAAATGLAWEAGGGSDLEAVLRFDQVVQVVGTSFDGWMRARFDVPVDLPTWCALDVTREHIALEPGVYDIRTTVIVTGAGNGAPGARELLGTISPKDDSDTGQADLASAAGDVQLVTGDPNVTTDTAIDIFTTAVMSGTATLHCAYQVVQYPAPLTVDDLIVRISRRGDIA